MGIFSSVANHTIGAGWRAVKDTVNGAMDGQLNDIAKIAVVAGIATGSIPLSTGAIALAGDTALGSVIDTFV